MFVARLLMICQCGSFKVGLALGCLPFVFLILGKVFFKNFAIKSKPVNIAIKWATALILAAAVCVLGTLGRFAGNTCGTCLNSELANSTFISFGDLLFSTASFGFILSISNLARAINPLLSNWILGVIFPLVVAAFSVMPLWTCLIVSHVQEVLYQANNDLNQSKK